MFDPINMIFNRMHSSLKLISTSSILRICHFTKRNGQVASNSPACPHTTTLFPKLLPPFFKDQKAEAAAVTTPLSQRPEQPTKN